MPQCCRSVFSLLYAARWVISKEKHNLTAPTNLSFSSYFSSYYYSITTSLTSQYVVFSIYGWQHLTYIIAADSHIHLRPRIQTRAGESHNFSRERKGPAVKKCNKPFNVFNIMHFKGKLKRFSQCLILKWTNLMKKNTSSLYVSVVCDITRWRIVATCFL